MARWAASVGSRAPAGLVGLAQPGRVSNKRDGTAQIALAAPRGPAPTARAHLRRPGACGAEVGVPGLAAARRAAMVG